MSTAHVNPQHIEPGHDGHAHDPHLAHHFDTPEQQFASAKMGMWVFLGTEILMFGGLFCAYAVYRHNHPDVFMVGHVELNKWMGAINTVVLIASSLTMAWAVRAAQLNQQKLLITLLSVTLLGGAGFMTIKAIEYATKYEHGLWVGKGNRYNKLYEGDPHHGGGHGEHPDGAPKSAGAGPDTGAAQATRPDASMGHSAEQTGAAQKQQQRVAAVVEAPATQPQARLPGPNYIDPNKGTADEARIRPSFQTVTGLAPRHTGAPAHHITFEELNQRNRERLNTFFSIYYLMTGLHGVHVLVGMGLIFWVLYRAATEKLRSWLLASIPLFVGLYIVFIGVLLHYHTVTMFVGGSIALLGMVWLVLGWIQSRHKPAEGGEFSEKYFTPVDLVGLYWHLVDLIWIFLFPLLYLIA